jgi:hypothetical protein
MFKRKHTLIWDYNWQIKIILKYHTFNYELKIWQFLDLFDFSCGGLNLIFYEN